ncbi:MAG: 4Fe-4S dicluster domain-containing protein [Ignavibacteria bacterium]|nr:4Fe-4S dicluster domain-containing protein [Ignavibacteria bacterium]
MDELRRFARELLLKKEVAAVIGYEQVGEARTRPVVITDPDECRRLVLNEYCLNNLVVYLNRARIKALARSKEGIRKLAVVAKPCDIRSIVALIQENQIRRENLMILSMNCHGVVRDFGCEFNGDNLAAKCISCNTQSSTYADKSFGEVREIPKFTGKLEYDLSEIEQLPPSKRMEFFREQFDKCIKCYACRAVCPLCYCQRCITDKTIPRWIESSSHSRGNFAWNIVRALHLSGRCTGCGECERACPMDIPLSLLNRKMAMKSKELFGYESGKSTDNPTLVGSYDQKDSDELFM